MQRTTLIFLFTLLAVWGMGQRIDARYFNGSHIGDLPGLTNGAACDSLYIPQYYMTGEGFHSNRYAVQEYFMKHFQEETNSFSGWITIRFLVNCTGRMSGFTLTCVDEDYIPAQCPMREGGQLLRLLHALPEWRFSYRPIEKDYYKYLTFTFSQGRLITVRP